MRASLSKALFELCQTWGIEFVTIEIYPSSYADLTTNLPCQLAKKMNLSPKDCALKLISCLSLPAELTAIEASKQGLINFYYTDDYKTRIIKDLMMLNIPWQESEEKISNTAYEARISAWEKSLTQFGLASFVSQFRFGQTSLDKEWRQRAMLQFFYLQCPPHIDLHLSVEVMRQNSLDNPWYAINYARKRNYFVIEELQARGVVDADLIFLDQWPAFSSALLAQLLSFNWQVEDIKRHGRIDELFTYTKNLARTMHYYYNRVTLLNTNPKMSSANLMLLQAAQRVLTGSLKLLGVNIE